MSSAALYRINFLYLLYYVDDFNEDWRKSYQTKQPFSKIHSSAGKTRCYLALPDHR